MQKSEKIYTCSCIFFTMLIVIGNLTYQKIVILPIPIPYVFELSVGAILYPLTFLITDLITEFYGLEKANFCVKCAICINIIISIIIWFMDLLPATSWSIIDNELFHKVFKGHSMSLVGSMLACYISQLIDISLYLWIRKITKGKYLWLRNNLSTAISLFVDTTIVIGFLSIVGILPVEQLWKLIANSYSWKLFFTIMSTPLFYFCVFTIGYIIKNEKYS